MKSRLAPEKVIIIAVALLMATGLIFIYSVSGPYSQQRDLSAWHFFVRQSIWAVLAMVALLIGSALNYRKFLKLSPVFLIMSVGLLVVVLIMPGKLNVHRWIELGFFRFQPSEIFKISLLMYMAFIMADAKGKPKPARRLLPHLAIAGSGLLLIAAQPDLGTMALIFGATLMLLFAAGLPLKYLVAPILAVLVLGGAMVFGLGYEKDRVDDYMASLNDPLGDGDEANVTRGYYQSRQSLISIGSGGLLGRGLGDGGQKNLFLPASHTDFIFSASAEEGGFVLCVAILTLFMAFGVAALKIARSATDLRGFLLAAGLGIMIVLQAGINIGVALGLLPITGITLPFFSYGGSSLVISCAAAGLIISVARHGGAPAVRRLKVR